MKYTRAHLSFSISNYSIRLRGNVVIIFKDLLFSFYSFSFVIWLPFLKFIKYMFTEKSFRAKAVKKLWSGHVILHNLTTYYLRYSIELVIGITLMLLIKLYLMRWLVYWLLKVPNNETFTQINGKELTQSRGKLHIAESLTLFFSCPCLALFGRRRRKASERLILEVQEAPLNLSDSMLTGIVPDSDGGCVLLIIDSTDN